MPGMRFALCERMQRKRLWAVCTVALLLALGCATEVQPETGATAADSVPSKADDGTDASAPLLVDGDDEGETLEIEEGRAFEVWLPVEPGGAIWIVVSAGEIGYV